MRASRHSPSNGHKNAHTVRRGVGGGRTSALAPGITAPEFELNSTPDQKVDLRHFQGRPVVLCFYPADWSPVCGDQLSLYNEILSEFERHNAQLLALSVDGVWCHTAYAQNRRRSFPLL